MSGLLPGLIHSNTSGMWLSIERNSVSVMSFASSNFCSSRNCTFVVSRISMLCCSARSLACSQVTISGSLPPYGIITERCGASSSVILSRISGDIFRTGGSHPS